MVLKNYHQMMHCEWWILFNWIKMSFNAKKWVLENKYRFIFNLDQPGSRVDISVNGVSISVGQGNCNFNCNILFKLLQIGSDY